MSEKRRAPEAYNAFIGGIEIRTILLKSLHVEYITETFAGPLTVDLQDGARYTNLENGIVNVYHDYKLNVKEEHISTPAITMDCTFIIAYHSPTVMTDEVFEIFKAINLRLNTWPYLRELVHSVCGRMNVPPLIAPVFKVP